MRVEGIGVCREKKEKEIEPQEIDLTTRSMLCGRGGHEALPRVPNFPVKRKARGRTLGVIATL